MNKLNYILLILISFALTSCASNKESADKIKNNLKEINVEEIKKEGLASTSSIYKEGPSLITQLNHEESCLPHPLKLVSQISLLQ
jgi:hypothetical protein